MAEVRIDRAALLPEFCRITSRGKFLNPPHIQLMTRRLHALAAREIRREMTLAPPRHGKLVADSTPVLTTNGWQRHGDLVPGDMVFGVDGKPARVVAISPLAMATLEVEMSDGSVVKVHPNHEWTVYERSRKKYRTMSTAALMKRSLWTGTRKKRCNFQLPPRATIQFPEAKLPLAPYLLGAWLGDGSTGKVCITHHVDDNEVVEAFQEAGFAVSCSHPINGGTTKSTSFGGGPNQTGPFGLAIRETGAFRNKHIPDAYKFASESQRLQLLAGLIDTDGHVGSDHRVRIVTVSDRLASDIADVVRSLGWRVSIYTQAPSLSSSGIQGKLPVHYVGFTPDRPIPTRVLRKRILGKPGSQRVIGIKEIRESKSPELGMCIRVDRPDGLYLVGKELIPTHNSQLRAIYFPAWYLCNFPHHRVVIASNSADLAIQFSGRVRDIIDEFGHNFGVRVREDRRAIDDWEIEFNGKRMGGGLYAVGVGGQLTGRGADCVTGETVVKTECGDIEIRRLVRLQSMPRVLTYNHVNGRTEWGRVVATRESATDELFEIETVGGRRIRATGKHRFFVQGRGYRQASSLACGDRLVVASEAPEGMRGVRRGPRSTPKRHVQALLQQGSQGGDGASLQVVRQGVSQAAIRVREVLSAGCESGLLLQPPLLEVAPRGQERREMRGVRRAHAGQARQSVLFRPVPSGPRAAGEAPPADLLPGVRRAVRPSEFAEHLLRSAVRREGSFSQDDRGSEFSLQGRHELREVVSCDEDANPGSGRVLLRGVPFGGIMASPCLARADRFPFVPCHSPHRRRPQEQSASESGNALPEVPHDAPQVETDTISVVRRVRCQGEPVYDIQLEGNHNFFGASILVHNCMIIDDPVKSAEEALSPGFRQKQWDWYASVADTRLEPGGIMCLTMTPWHGDDLHGRILDIEPEEWDVLKLPALAEEDDPLGRKEGEPLWPARYGPEFFERKRKQDPFWFDALFQLRPRPKDGGMFKDHWFKDKIVFGSAPLHAKRVRFWDKASTKGGGDWTVGLLMSYYDGYFWIEDVKRGQWGTTDRDAIILQTCQEDNERFPSVVTWGEQEPGSGGKESAEGLVKILAGYRVQVLQSTGSKVARAEPFANQCAGGNVFLTSGPWNQQYLKELLDFPNGKHDDQVDASSGAFNRLFLTRSRGGEYVTDARDVNLGNTFDHGGGYVT